MSEKTLPSINIYFDRKTESKLLFQIIRQAGFGSVLLFWDDKFHQDYRKHPDLARKADLDIYHIHAPYSTINNLWLDNLEGRTLLENHLQYISDCAEFEITTMVMHLSSGDNPPPYNTLGLDRLKKIIEKAEKHNVRVALENLRKVDYLEYVLTNITSPQCGFCFDSGHQHHRSPDVELLQKHGSRLMALHLHDNDQTADQHLLPFDGTIDWDTTIKKIAATGYKGAVSLEVTGYKDLSPEAFLQKAYDVAEQLKQMPDPFYIEVSDD
ncbi:MAG: sugar phosphate isomerase/epimerase [Defluviitaleaceae bacterium]|nr:sugar phosphate isomerase/epimerase [Defluviitaleaceae bacterium]